MLQFLERASGGRGEGPSANYQRQITEARGTPIRITGQVYSAFPPFSLSPLSDCTDYVDNTGFVGNTKTPCSLLNYFSFSSSWTDSQ